MNDHPFLSISWVDRDSLMQPMLRSLVPRLDDGIDVGFIIRKLFFVDFKDIVGNRYFLVIVDRFTMLFDTKDGGGKLVSVRIEDSAESILG